MEYNITTLSCGLRIIHLPSASPVVYLGYQIACGARNEAPGDEGLAHFCEHMTFKGTRRRHTPLSIASRLESVGGDLNAYTNKETTTYHSAVLTEHVDRAIDLLTDIVFCSTYPQAEIDKEVEVICDEIDIYNDSPEDLIYDDMENLVFSGHPLGHYTLGTAERVRQFTTADAQRFTDRYYRPENAIFFCSGNIRFDRLVRLLEKSLQIAGLTTPHAPLLKTSHAAQNASPAAPKTEPAAQETNLARQETNLARQETNLAEQKTNLAEQKTMREPVVKELNYQQSHVMLGSPTFDINDPRRLHLYLLSNILGGPGASARLYQVLREKRGLVYSAYTNLVSYADTGLWTAYFGCDDHDVSRCLRLVRSELKRWTEHPVSTTRLAAAKRQLKGQIGIASDNREAFALDFGKGFLHYGRLKNVDRLYQQLDAITPTDILDVARYVFSPERIHTLIFK